MDVTNLSDEMKQKLARGFKFAENTGVELVELAAEHVTMKMPAKGNENHVGTMYAGALFTLAELPGGVICFAAFDTPAFYFLSHLLRKLFDLEIGEELEL